MEGANGEGGGWGFGTPSNFKKNTHLPYSILLGAYTIVLLHVKPCTNSKGSRMINPKVYALF
jgi:hypothetical protein